MVAAVRLEEDGSGGELRGARCGVWLQGEEGWKGVDGWELECVACGGGGARGPRLRRAWDGVVMAGAERGGKQLGGLRAGRVGGGGIGEWFLRDVL